MSDKVARLGIKRDNDLMYYIKQGDVWAVPRKQKGQPKGKAKKVASPGIDMDYSKYLYFLDADGDVARKARAGGGKKVKAPANGPKGVKKTKVADACPPCPPSKTPKKQKARIGAELDAILKKTKPRSKRG